MGFKYEFTNYRLSAFKNWIVSLYSFKSRFKISFIIAGSIFSAFYRMRPEYSNKYGVVPYTNIGLYTETQRLLVQL